MTTFTISRNKLYTALQHLHHVFMKRQAMPIFDDYHFEIEGDRLKITVTDGEIMGIEKITIDKETLKIDNLNTIRWCVDKYFLSKGIKTLDEQELTINVYEYQIEVLHSNGMFRIPTDSGVEQFPERMPLGNLCDHLNLEAPGLKGWLNTMRDAMANDELRPVMNAVMLNCTPDNMEVVASDGYKLFIVHKDGEYPELKLVIPRRVVGIIHSILPRTGFLSLDVFEKRTCIYIEYDNGNSLDLSFKPVDGRFPNYQSVIPQEFNAVISVNRKELLRALERITIFSSESSRLCKISTNGAEHLNLSTSWEDYETSSDETVPCEIKFLHECQLKLGVNCVFLSQVLRSITTQKVQIHFRSSSSAFVVYPDPQSSVEKRTFLMMTMMLSD